jgi:hypothetical protein
MDYYCNRLVQEVEGVRMVRSDCGVVRGGNGALQIQRVADLVVPWP